ncbi:hypothetical protein B0T13DRAFT_453173 [Neurospora crassa]|nr:hypothetical protein B0T13DRAFT_453173 [Neurospora crassa]
MGSIPPFMSHFLVAGLVVHIVPNTTTLPSFSQGARNEPGQRGPARHTARTHIHTHTAMVGITLFFSRLFKPHSPDIRHVDDSLVNKLRPPDEYNLANAWWPRNGPEDRRTR